MLSKAAEVANDALKAVSWSMYNLAEKKQCPFLAADYLYAVLNKERSFRLYARFLEADTSPQQVLSETVLACARAAETEAQRNLIKTVLSHRLSTEDCTASSSERALANMLLAQIYSLNGVPALSKHHLALSTTTRSSTSVDASFDVLAYLYSMHPQEIASQPRVQGQPSKSISAHMRSISCKGFVQFALALRYASLSLNSTEKHEYPGTVVSDCVRSCVDWCATSVDNKMLRQSFDTDWLAQGTSNYSIRRWPQSLALYNYLYRKWRSDEFDWEAKFVHWGWRSRTRGKIGISASELLVVCSDMITRVGEDLAPESDGDEVGNSDPPGVDLLENIRAIQNHTDKQLVTRFLQHLYLRTTNCAPSSKATEDSRHRLHSPGMATERAIVPSRADQMNAPPAPASNRYSHASSSHNSITWKRYTPTIASSLGSSNASYRRMREAALLIKGRYTSTGSKASLASQDGRVSLIGSIVSISDIMRDSLSISEAPFQDHSLQRVNESRLSQEVEDCI